MVFGPTPYVFGHSVMMAGACDRRVTSGVQEVEEGSRAAWCPCWLPLPSDLLQLFPTS